MTMSRRLSRRRARRSCQRRSQQQRRRKRKSRKRLKQSLRPRLSRSRSQSQRSLEPSSPSPNGRSSKQRSAKSRWTPQAPQLRQRRRRLQHNRSARLSRRPSQRHSPPCLRRPASSRRVFSHRTSRWGSQKHRRRQHQRQCRARHYHQRLCLRAPPPATRTWRLERRLTPTSRLHPWLQRIRRRRAVVLSTRRQLEQLQACHRQLSSATPSEEVIRGFRLRL